MQLCVYAYEGACLFACSDITKIELVHSVGEEFSIGDTEQRRMKLKYAWQLAPCCYGSSTADCPQAVQISITTLDDSEVAPGKAYAYI